MLYYIKGPHMREFGFPRLQFNKPKPFKWKKTNFVTDLPKHSALSCYLVAKTSGLSNAFFMHVSTLSRGKSFHV